MYEFGGMVMYLVDCYLYLNLDLVVFELEFYFYN